MKFGHSPLLSFKSLTGSGLRLGLTLVIVLIVISSTIFTLVNPAALAKTDLVPSSPLPTISTIPSAPSTIGQNGREGEFTIQALSSLTARPTNNIVNTNSFYDVIFLTASSGAIKKIQVTFPAGTTVPSSASFNEAQGIGGGTVSKSGQTLTYTVTNAVNIPAGTKIRLEFSNINNPLNPSANYKVTVTTRNAANTVIDGPTQSTAYTMKQVGVNAIANNAITTPKIADGAITSTKIASTFAYSREVLDGSSNWNPNGVSMDFGVTDSLLRGDGLQRVLINLESPISPAPICGVTLIDTNFLQVSCSSAPADGTNLRYTVFDAPFA